MDRIGIYTPSSCLFQFGLTFEVLPCKRDNIIFKTNSINILISPKLTRFQKVFLRVEVGICKELIGACMALNLLCLA